MMVISQYKHSRNSCENVTQSSHGYMIAGTSAFISCFSSKHSTKQWEQVYTTYYREFYLFLNSTDGRAYIRQTAPLRGEIDGHTDNALLLQMPSDNETPRPNCKCVSGGDASNSVRVTFGIINQDILVYL